MNKHFAFLIEADPSGILANGPANDIYGLAGKLLDLGYLPQNVFIFREGKASPIPKLKRIVDSSGVKIINTLKPLDEIREIIGTVNYQHVIMGISGDGMQVKDISGDEIDGLDEMIGNILDDDIFNLLCSLKPDSQVWLLTDSCHSATLGDLPFTLNGDSWSRITRRPVITDPKSLIVELSPIRDSSSIMSEYSEWYGGALFLGIVQNDVLELLIDNISRSTVNEVKIAMTKWFASLHEQSSNVLEQSTIGELVVTSSQKI